MGAVDGMKKVYPLAARFLGHYFGGSGKTEQFDPNYLLDTDSQTRTTINNEINNAARGSGDDGWKKFLTDTGKDVYYAFRSGEYRVTTKVIRESNGSSTLQTNLAIYKRWNFDPGEKFNFPGWQRISLRALQSITL